MRYAGTDEHSYLHINGEATRFADEMTFQDALVIYIGFAILGLLAGPFLCCFAVFLLRVFFPRIALTDGAIYIYSSGYRVPRDVCHYSVSFNTCL